jgi:16S rRNA (guanine966-N2)-methyltransferase
MLRIIAGELGGRKLLTPEIVSTHPMSEKLRGAIFSALGDISDLRVMDAYAGSGAVGIEAMSRGAAAVLAIESAKPAQANIMQNLELLGLSMKSGLYHFDKATYQLLGMTVERYVGQNLASWRADVIIADPPFDALKLETIELLTDQLASKGLLVLCHTSKIPSPQVKSVELIRSKQHGAATSSYYRKTA